MAQYESEHTKFMRDWLAQHPEQIAEQQAGRALWWDKAPQSPEERRRQQEAKVPRKAYYYS